MREDFDCSEVEVEEVGGPGWTVTVDGAVHWEREIDAENVLQCQYHIAIEAYVRGGPLPKLDTERVSKDVHGINACRVEGAHARIMVQTCVDAVHTNSVDSELFQVGYITSASSCVRERVHKVAWFRERRPIKVFKS